jgi:hypothetical protein
MKRFTVRQFFIVLTFVAILICLLPLEYDNFKLKTVIYPFVWTSIAVIILKVLPRHNSLLKVIFVIFGAIVYLLLTGLFVFGSLICSWTDNGTFYISKSDKSVKLICRTYDCVGTVDNCKLYKEKYLTKHIKWITEFNDKPIDTTKWREVSFNSDEFRQP